jgi:hypothetical protein
VMDDFFVNADLVTPKVPVQPPPVCLNGVWPPVGQDWPIAGGTDTVTLSAPFDCAWQASTPNPWIHLTTTNGVGDAYLEYSIEPNTGAERIGEIVIDGWSFRVVQFGEGSETEVPLPGGEVVRLAHAPTVLARIAPEGTAVYELVPGVVVDTASDGTTSYEVPAANRWFPEWGFLDSEGIHWASGPNGDRVNGCLGNCGAGCSTRSLLGGHLPCASKDYWSRQPLTAPSYHGIEGRVECIGREDYDVEYEIFAMPVRWTYYGNISVACYAHDLMMRDSIFLKWTLGVVSALPAALTSCIGVGPAEWSYETLQFGRKFQSATRGSYPEGSGACRVP